MKSIVTVVGKDRVGIIAEVCTFLSQRGLNILDLSQTITGGYFNMLMIVQLPDELSFGQTATALAAFGASIGMQMGLQREDLFAAMHSIDYQSF